MKPNFQADTIDTTVEHEHKMARPASHPLDMETFEEKKEKNLQTYSLRFSPSSKAELS